MRQKLNPLSHTPVPSVSSKVTYNSRNIVKGRLNKNRKSVGAIKFTESESEHAYSSIGVEGLSTKDKTFPLTSATSHVIAK